MMRLLCRLVALTMPWTAVAAELPGFVWPTPNRAYFEDGGFSTFVQPTQSGLPGSGLFGCVRTSGHQFHEGIDLLPVTRDRRGEPTDPVFAMFSGTVRHVNSRSGLSSYGRYIVIEHTDLHPRVVSLYAHLRSVADGLSRGNVVTAGQTIGGMGRSAAGYTIPKERAHVHVEMGFWLSEKFQVWYDAQKFGSRNRHGVFNGFNIVGFDWLDFVDRVRSGEVGGLNEYLARLPVAATVFVRDSATPDFVQRYPELLRAPLPPDGRVVGWRIDFTWYGLPKSWWPVTPAEAERMPKANGLHILFQDEALLRRYPCQTLIETRRGHPSAGDRLDDVVSILFAGR